MPARKPLPPAENLKLINAEIEHLQAQYQRNEVNIVLACDEQNLIRAQISALHALRSQLRNAQARLEQTDAAQAAVKRLVLKLAGVEPNKVLH